MDEKAYNISSIILLPFNNIITIVNLRDNGYYDIVVSNGKPPYTLFKIPYVTENQLQEIENHTYESEISIIPDILNIINKKYMGKHIDYLDEEYIVSGITDSGYITLDKVSNPVYTIDMNREDLIIKLNHYSNVVNQESIERSYIVNENTKEENETAFEEIISNIIECGVTSPYTEEQYRNDVMNSKIPSFEKEGIYMKEIIDRVNDAMSLLDTNRGEELMGEIIEFFKTLVKKDKEDWYRELRINLDSIITSDEKITIIKDSELEEKINDIYSNFEKTKDEMVKAIVKKC